MRILNIAGYTFFEAGFEAKFRDELLGFCRKRGLRGTIYLTPEGVNVNLSGFPEAIRDFQIYFHQEHKIPFIDYKENWSDDFIFRRMLVKRKKEVITFRESILRPLDEPAPRIKPTELKQWYDSNKDFLIIDTRNNFEVEMGTFKKAYNPQIKEFTEFKKVVDQLPEKWKEKPIVTFCTGGVRCEKAAPYMLKKGFKNVLQLDGGILNYFSKCGGSHWEGECFVFDRRVGVSPDLKETESVYCFLCGNPLTKSDQVETNFEAGKPCFRCPSVKNAARINDQIND